MRLGFPPALTVSWLWAGDCSRNSGIFRILFKNKYANMPDITSSWKRPGHGIYVIVHTLVSKCKVGRWWGCLSRHNIIQCVGVRAVLPYQNQRQIPKINNTKKRMQNVVAQLPVHWLLLYYTGKTKPRRDSLSLRPASDFSWFCAQFRSSSHSVPGFVYFSIQSS